MRGTLLSGGFRKRTRSRAGNSTDSPRSARARAFDPGLRASSTPALPAQPGSPEQTALLHRALFQHPGTGLTRIHCQIHPAFGGRQIRRGAALRKMCPDQALIGLGIRILQRTLFQQAAASLRIGSVARVPEQEQAELTTCIVHFGRQGAFEQFACTLQIRLAEQIVLQQQAQP